MNLERASDTPSLPSIAELGRRLEEIADAHAMHDEESIRCKSSPREQDRHLAAMTIVERQREVIAQLVATMPAKTIHDAAVQAEVAFTMADAIRDCQDEGEERIDDVRRLLLSILPVLCKAAGIDTEKRPWAESMGLHAWQFESLEDPT